MKTLLKTLFGATGKQRAELEADIALADAQGPPSEAIAARRALLAVFPSDAPSWASLAACLRRDGQAQEAVLA
jgi:Flp pilus assembly protein TadD